jgi:predicted dehydrogenase
MEKQLKIAVVGAGGMGTVHISNYAHIENCKVTAVCDPTEAGAAKARETGAALYADINEMLANEDADIVDICTPTFLHKPQVMAALEAGRHVVCEKPAALLAADAKAMFALAREKSRRLFIGHVVQYAPETKVLRGLVKSGEYGRPLDAQFLRLSACPRWVKNGWLFEKEKSGLLPFDLHIHDLDLIVSLFGVPETADYTRCGRERAGFAEHYRFLYGYKGMNVAAEAAWYNADFPFAATWRVYFEEAVVVNDGKAVTAYRFDHEPRVFDTEEKIKIPTGINVPPTGMYYEELSDFLGQLRAGKPASAQAREREIVSALEILETIR